MGRPNAFDGMGLSFHQEREASLSNRLHSGNGASFCGSIRKMGHHGGRSRPSPIQTPNTSTKGGIRQAYGR